LVISAAGNPDKFDCVEKIVAAAPEMKDWEVIAFKQPHGPDFKTEYEGIVFDPSNTIVLTLENPDHPGAVGIQVCFEGYEEEMEEAYMGGTFLMLDAVLGEKSTALDIDYIEVTDIPDELEDVEYIHLSELAEHIVYVKTRE
jgi:hypothetical protein